MVPPPPPVPPTPPRAPSPYHGQNQQTAEIPVVGQAPSGYGVTAGGAAHPQPGYGPTTASSIYGHAAHPPRPDATTGAIPLGYAYAQPAQKNNSALIVTIICAFLIALLLIAAFIFLPPRFGAQEKAQETTVTEPPVTTTPDPQTTTPDPQTTNPAPQPTTPDPQTTAPAPQNPTPTPLPAPNPVNAPPTPVWSQPAGTEGVDTGYTGGNFMNVAKSGPTSDAFAINVREHFRAQYLRTSNTNPVLSVYSPVTDITYTMYCANNGTHIHCTGGNDAHVYLW